MLQAYTLRIANGWIADASHYCTEYIYGNRVKGSMRTLTRVYGSVFILTKLTYSEIATYTSSNHCQNKPIHNGDEFMFQLMTL